jgi:NDP-sugar pyrophosphorylase family protein
MRGVILAAGYGTRLWPLTEDRTKPAIPFLNRPLIAYSVEYLAAHDFNDIVINLHHQPESVRHAVGDGRGLGASVTYSFEEEILGTSGALDRARDLLTDDDFAVINGKIVTSINLRAAFAHHKQRSALATLILRPNHARERFSVVHVGSSERVTGFGGFPEPISRRPDEAGERRESGRGSGQPAPPLEPLLDPPPVPPLDLNLVPPPDTPLMFTGIQVLSPRIFDYIPRNRFSHSTVDVYPKAIEAGELVLAHISDGDWFEMSTLERYLEASLAFLHNQGRNVICGADSVIEDSAAVVDSVIWSRARVERGATVNYAVMGDGVTIPAGSNIERAIVVRRDIVRKVERGEIVGDNLIVPLAVGGRE